MEHAEFHDYQENPQDCVYPPGVREEAMVAWQASMAKAVAFYNTNLVRYGPNAAATTSKRARFAPRWPAWAIIEDEFGDIYQFPHGAVQATDGQYYMRPPNAEGSSLD